MSERTNSNYDFELTQPSGAKLGLMLRPEEVRDRNGNLVQRRPTVASALRAAATDSQLVQEDHAVTTRGFPRGMGFSQRQPGEPRDGYDWGDRAYTRSEDGALPGGSVVEITLPGGLTNMPIAWAEDYEGTITMLGRGGRYLLQMAAP